MFGKVNIKKQKTLGVNAIMSVQTPADFDATALIDQMIDEQPVGKSKAKTPRKKSAKKKSKKKY